MSEIIYKASILCQQGQYDQCIQLLQNNLNILNNQPEVFYIMGVAFHQCKQNEQALRAYRKAVELDPNYVQALFNLGGLLSEEKKYNYAIKCYKKCLSINSDHAKTYDRLAVIYRELNSFQLALKYHNRAVKRQRRIAEFWTNLAVTFMKFHEYESAQTILQHAIKLKGPNANRYYFLASTCFQQGKFKHAQLYWNKTLKYDPEHINTYIDKLNFTKFSNKFIDVIEKKLKNKDLNISTKQLVYFSLGNNYARNSSHKTAFEYWKLANKLKREQLDYSIENDRYLFQYVKKTFTKDFFISNTKQGSQCSKPVFIVGMPRSGSTLVEQILDCHPDVYGAGELDLLNRCINGLKKKYNQFEYQSIKWDKLPENIFQELGNKYCEKISKIQPNVARVCDKALSNYTLLGWIVSSLPNAKIIHCRRHPLDTCLSCFTTEFVGDYQPFTYSLEDLSQIYQLYEDLMIYWYEVLPVKIHEIKYEKLIFEFENQVDLLLDYCDLEWNDKCLSFYDSKRIVKTASKLQVNKPLYNKSVNRWVAYAEYLRPYFPERYFYNDY